MTQHIMLQEINFTGPQKQAGISFNPGVNVICGASETGKSFLAESIDFMLGASELKEIPERHGYSTIDLKFSANGNLCKLRRSISGGAFILGDANQEESEKIKLKASHAHDKIDNLSGYLLNIIGLLGRRILKNSTKGKTQSLSFRNLARLVIIQDGEIQQKGSPFLSGQYIQKTSDLATLKLVLTGIDDSAIITADEGPDNTRELVLLDELIEDLSSDISDAGHEKSELSEQLVRLNKTIEDQRANLRSAQDEMDQQLAHRRELYSQSNAIQDRIHEIGEFTERFNLLKQHYEIDKSRLAAIQESGSLFAYIEPVICPLCGAPPDTHQAKDACDGDVAATVKAASAELKKIRGLVGELDETLKDLGREKKRLSLEFEGISKKHSEVDKKIQEFFAPDVADARASFSEIVETKSTVQTSIAMYDRLERLNARKASLLEVDTTTYSKIDVDLPSSIAHAFSMKIEHILRAWHFPGDCRVHYDKETSDFVIDGKPRSSRGQGLRAITHAAITIALLEYCRDHNLPHPGFVVMDSPLLAYYEPEGAEDEALQGSDLKVRFYEYLKAHHGKNSQIIIIDNQHPPSSVETGINLIIFTRNPSDGRFGLL